MPSLAQRLADAGFVAPDEEAAELTAAARDDGELDAMLARRLTGEPLAWITGTTTFCGLAVRVDPGVYVPRWHTEVIAERAAQLLPDGGVAVDLCCGSGAIGAVLRARRPAARVVGTDLDPRACACARTNGVEALEGDVLAPLPPELRGHVDVITGVVPYVPTSELALLQRDTLTFEGTLAYDGGPDGAALLRRALREAPAWLRPGGALVLELGGEQAALLGLDDAEVLRDADGDVRGVVVTVPR